MYETISCGKYLNNGIGNLNSIIFYHWTIRLPPEDHFLLYFHKHICKNESNAKYFYCNYIYNKSISYPSSMSFSSQQLEIVTEEQLQSKFRVVKFSPHWYTKNITPSPNGHGYLQKKKKKIEKSRWIGSLLWDSIS